MCTLCKVDQPCKSGDTSGHHPIYVRGLTYGRPSVFVDQPTEIPCVVGGHGLPDQRVQAQFRYIEIFQCLVVGEELGKYKQVGVDSAGNIKEVLRDVEGRAVAVVDSKALRYPVWQMKSHIHHSPRDSHALCIIHMHPRKSGGLLPCG